MQAGRYLFNRPITGAYEITTNYLMIAAVFLGVSYGYRQGAYIRVTFLVDHLPGAVKLVVNHFVQMLSVVYGVLLVIATYKQALRTIATHTTLSSLDFIPVGAGLCDRSCGPLLHVPGHAARHSQGKERGHLLSSREGSPTS